MSIVRCHKQLKKALPNSHLRNNYFQPTHLLKKGNGKTRSYYLNIPLSMVGNYIIL